MVNRYLDTGVLLRRRQGRRAHQRPRFQRAEGRLRFRHPLPRTVRHTAPRRAGQEPRSQRLLHLLVVGCLSEVTRPWLHQRFSSRARRAGFLVLSVGALGLFTAGASTQGPRFYPDDPIAREPESQDASKAAPYDQSQMYELMYNLFVTSGYEPSGLRAKNINTIDEVPDSSWFTNRVGSRADDERRARARPERRRATGPVEVGAHPGEDVRRAPGLHGDGRQGRDLVPRVRSAEVPGRRDRRRRDRDQDLLGARLQPGGIVPDDLRSEEGHDRSEGHGSAAERKEDTVHA